MTEQIKDSMETCRIIVHATVEDLVNQHRYNDAKEIEFALNDMLKAFEKQIPKKPKQYIAFDGIERNGCPNCPRNEILYAGQNYCSVCGQKINWSDKDEEKNE